MADEPNIELINDKWQNILPQYESNWFDLAIVDPPYGIGAGGEMGAKNCDRWNNPRLTGYKKKNWDNEKPRKPYFDELFRVSKNQIIWGANHYCKNLNASRGWIVWDKKRSGNYSKCEIAYSSFDKPLELFEWLWNGFQKQRPEKRIHPTQKPVALYKWLLENYANEGDKILDTHLGSGSSAIAAWQKKHDFVGIECDKEYFEDMLHRFKMNTDRGYAMKQWQKDSEENGQQTIFS